MAVARRVSSWPVARALMTTDEGDLDGLAVLERGELDVLAGDEVATGFGGVAEAAVTLGHPGVEETVGFEAESG